MLQFVIKAFYPHNSLLSHNSFWGNKLTVTHMNQHRPDIHVFASQGLEPWLTNADAGARRPPGRTRPPIRQTNSSLKSSTKCFRTPQIGIGLTYILPTMFFAFMFHFYVSTYWLSILLKAEIYDFYVSFLVSMFHSKNTEGEKQKHCGSDSKPLWEQFKNTEGAWKRSLSVLKNETWN